jgi:hypothetical protein
MAYVPPHKREGSSVFGSNRDSNRDSYRAHEQRREQERARLRAEEAEASFHLPPVTDDHFPALGGSRATPRSRVQAGTSYAAQADAWRIQREQDEYDQKVREELERMKAERQRLARFEESLMRQSLAGFRRPSSPPPPTRVARPSFSDGNEDEWTDVGESKRLKQLERKRIQEQRRMQTIDQGPLSDDDEAVCVYDDPPLTEEHERY